jgi:hypothetical protein
MKKLMIFGVALTAWVCFSCEEFCEESNRTAIVVNFYSSKDGSLLPSNVMVTAIIDDEIDSILSVKQNYSQVLLPVNPSADEMMFVFENGDLIADTVKFTYVRHNGFISAECGCVTYAEITDTERTQNSIINLVVTNPVTKTVSYRQGVSNAENIRIYY